MKYVARSASNTTDDWPLWYVEYNGKNAICDIYTLLHKTQLTTLPFVPKAQAVLVSSKMNGG